MIYLRFIFYYLYLVSLKQQTAEKRKLFFFLIKNGSVYLFWEGAGNHNSHDEGMGALTVENKKLRFSKLKKTDFLDPPPKP